MRCASAESVVMVPATPTQVRARSTGTTRSASPSRLAHHFARGRDLDGGGRIGVQAAFGQPDTADVGGEAGLHLTLPQHHLGGSAAEVDDHERPCGEVQFVDRTAERQLGFLVAGDHLGDRARHDGAQHVGRHREEHVAVGGVPGGRRRDHAHLRNAWRRSSSA